MDFKRTKIRIGDVLLETGIITEEQLHMDIIDLQNVNISRDIPGLVSPAVLKKNLNVPIARAFLPELFFDRKH